MGTKTKSKLSSAEKCLAIVKDLTVFSDDKNYYALLEEKGSRQVVARLPSQDFEEWLSSQFTDKYKSFIKTSDVRGIVNQLRNKAKNSGEVRDIFMRFAQDSSGNSLIDLCNRKDNKAIVISEKGWEVKEQKNIMFTVDTHLQPLIEPDANSDVFDALKIFKYVNVNEPMDQVAILAWMCSLPKDIEHPILLLKGKKASGKSTAARNIRMIYDNAKPLIMSIASNEADIALNFFKNPVCFIDNMDTVTPSIANLFCKAVTGDGHSKRLHYTNAQLIHFEYERPLIITALRTPSIRGDFLSRCLKIDMPEIKSRNFVGREFLKENFKVDIPKIFGGLLHLTAAAMSEMKFITLNDKSRLVDFDLFACGVAKALGVDPCKFMASRLDSAEELSCSGENREFFESLIEMVDSKDGILNATAQDLVDELITRLDEEISVHSLGKKFSNNAAVLDDLSISVNKKRGKSGTFYEIIRNKPETSDLISITKHCCDCIHYEGAKFLGNEYCNVFKAYIYPDEKGVRCPKYVFAVKEWEYEELEYKSDVDQDDLPNMMELYGTAVEEHDHDVDED